MKQPMIGYTVEFEIEDFEAFQQVADEVIPEIEENEPDTVLYEWFVSEDRESARLVEGFTDSQGAVAHLTGPVLTPMMPELMEAGEITNVELFGTPSEKLSQVLSDFPVSGSFEPMDGFTR